MTTVDVDADADVAQLTSKGMVSDTYTPSSWWGPSRYWHGAGVENG